MDMNATLSPAITLNVHICNQRRSYEVKFFGEAAEDAALAFITKRYEAKGPNDYGNHVISELQEAPVGSEFGRLLDLLHPLCEHGMSADLCAGPNHYPADRPEDDFADDRYDGWGDPELFPTEY